MPVETIVVMMPMAAKGAAAGLASMKPPLAIKLAAASKAKAALATKYPVLGHKMGGPMFVTASKPGLTLPYLAKTNNLAAQLTASQPTAAPGAAATTTVTTSSLLSKASNLVGQAQALIDTVSNNIVPLLGTAFAGVAGGVAGGGAVQWRRNKQQKGMIDSLSIQTEAQQQAVANLQSELSTTQEKVAQIAADKAEPTVETVEPVPATPPVAAEPSTLEDVKGIGPIFAERLNEAGIYTLAGLAQLTPEQITEIMEKDGHSFSGDPEDWLKQARELAE